MICNFVQSNLITDHCQVFLRCILASAMHEKFIYNQQADIPNILEIDFVIRQ